MHSRATLYPGA